MREIEASQMKIDSEKFRANRRNVENLDFMATISPRNQQQEKYTAEIRNAICEGDQQVFMVLLSVAFFADTPDELRQETDALQSAASNFNCRFTEMRFQQENCFNTAMPYGLRRVESSHMMLTRSVTALVPFVAQEVQSPQGIFYGRNAITGNLIVGDRTKLINGNAMVIATSGSGKSMSVKMEIIMEFCAGRTRGSFWWTRKMNTNCWSRRWAARQSRCLWTAGHTLIRWIIITTPRPMCRPMLPKSSLCCRCWTS